MLEYEPENRIGTKGLHKSLKKIGLKYKRQISQECPREISNYLQVGNNNGSSSGGYSSNISGSSQCKDSWISISDEDNISDIGATFTEDSVMVTEEIKSLDESIKLNTKEQKELDNFLEMDDYLKQIVQENDPNLYNRISGLKNEKYSEADTNVHERMIPKLKPTRSISSTQFENQHQKLPNEKHLIKANKEWLPLNSESTEKATDTFSELKSDEHPRADVEQGKSCENNGDDRDTDLKKKESSWRDTFINIEVDSFETKFPIIKGKLAIYMQLVSEYASNSELRKAQNSFSKLADGDVSILKPKMIKFLKNRLKKKKLFSFKTQQDIIDFLTQSDDYWDTEFLQRYITIEKIGSYDQKAVDSIFNFISVDGIVSKKTFKKIIARYIDNKEEIKEIMSSVSKSHKQFNSDDFNTFMHN